MRFGYTLLASTEFLHMKRTLWTCGLVVLSVLVGCSSPPSGSPRCSGASFVSGPADSDGDGNPDGLGIGISFPFVLCSIPGSEFQAYVHTVLVGSTRVYEIRMTGGANVGKVYTAKDIYDAISVMDQVFAANGYDMAYAETIAYRNAWKDWLIANLMTPNDFHSTYGY